MIKLNSIKWKLIASFLVPVALITFLGYVSYTKSSIGAEQSYEQSTLTSLSLASDYFYAVLNNVQNKALQLGTDEALVKYFSGRYSEDIVQENQRRTEISKRIYSASIGDAFISDVYAFADYGSAMSTAGMIPKDMYNKFLGSPEEEEYKNSGENRYYLTEHETLDKETRVSSDKYCLSLITKLSGVTYKKIGYILVDIKSECILEQLDKLNIEGGIFTSFVAGNGKEIMRGDIPDGFRFSDQDFYTKSQSLPNNSGAQYINYNGQTYLYAYSKIKDTNMALCTLIPKAIIVKQSESVKKITIIIVIVACVIAILIGMIMASGISRIIKKINKVLEKVAQGDLTAKVKTRRKDEFRVLSNGISNMLNSMKQIIYQVLGVSNTVAASVKEVSGGSEQLLEATKGIQSAANEIQQVTLDQSKEAEHCLSQMESLAEEISTVYENANQIETITSDTRQIIKKGIVMVDNLGERAKDTSNITQIIIKDMESLEKESQDINSIIKTINGISSKTNLLSFNASIEAARAGEAGKGFAVVANEIRDLAYQSQQAASQIGEIIKQIQERTGQTAETVKQAERIVASQEEALTETEEVFQEMTGHIEGLTKNLEGITIGITKMEHAKDDTLGAVQSISSTSEKTSIASKELTKTAENQLVAVKILNQTAVELREDASKLEKFVKIFRVNE